MKENQTDTEDNNEPRIRRAENKGEKTTVHVYENEKRMIEFIQDKEPYYDELGKRTVIREALYALADDQGIDMPLAQYWCRHYDPDRDSEDDTNN